MNDAIFQFPELLSPKAVWRDGAWTEPYQVFDYARLGLEFLAGHLPGAQHVEKSLVWTEVDGVAGMVPHPVRLAEALGVEGFDPSRPALVYDGGNALYASRLAWALAVAGWTKVVLLEGGLAAWKKAGFPTNLGTTPKPRPQDVTAGRRQDLYATREEVQNRSADTILLDTRTQDEFIGKDRRSARAGRIPGAVHWEWKNALGTDGLTFRSAEALTADFAALGIGPSTKVITYCQSGVRAAHALFALRKAGVVLSKNYDGSWEEWGNREDLPLVTGDSP